MAIALPIEHRQDLLQSLPSPSRLRVQCQKSLKLSRSGSWRAELINISGNYKDKWIEAQLQATSRGESKLAIELSPSDLAD
jgi:hypothetical protein